MKIKFTKKETRKKEPHKVGEFLEHKHSPDDARLWQLVQTSRDAGEKEEAFNLVNVDSGNSYFMKPKTLAECKASAEEYFDQVEVQEIIYSA